MTYYHDIYSNLACVVDIKALRYFIEVVNLQSFTAAAEALNVTQPTISKMVKNLEEELGTPLLLREYRRFHLTDAGRVVLNRGLDVLAAEARLQAELADLNTMAVGELTLGVPPLAGMLFIPLIANFKRLHPQIELSLREEGGKAIEAALDTGELEIGGLLLPVDENRFETLPLSDDRLVLVAAATSKWQGRSEVRLTELSTEHFVLYSASYSLNDRVQAACQTQGFSPQIAGRSGQWEFMVALVESGLGVALLPESVARRIPAGRCVIAALSEPEIPWRIALGWRKDVYLSRAARAWIEALR
ncbi:LysR family transcriptional regulator [Iodobacter sp. HSC-16F04]|uniref:LysR family transcriptional regulator n=1 Tax=Iodobacter violaceini TaxID=3044271 RepID=A0ABX0KZG9_9NEIS|nr:LysR family transcriptional regulator [Iodobacter violacea]NHQ88003.1 LysR family transcriptional regulator [Iodobacter violacea]